MPDLPGADIRQVPLTPNVDFFAELEHTIKMSFPKPKMLIIGAAMRKLIHVAFGVLKSGRPYDASCAQA